MIRKVSRLVVAMAALAVAGVAQAGPAPHEHDGFYLNLEGGFGALSSSASQAGTDMKLSGGAGIFGLGLGGCITPNFEIGGRVWGVVASSPDVEINGVKYSTTDTSLQLTGIGVDLTYFIMPINIYLQATPSIGMLSVKQGGTSADANSGFAIRLAAGKEWFVSDNWGIGLNLQYAHSSNKDKGTDPPTWGSNWFGVAFSATYN